MTRFVVTLFLIVAVAEWTVRSSGLLSPTMGSSIANSILLLATVLFYRILSQTTDPQRFTQVYLISIVGKILLACILIVVVILLDRSKARSNVIFLFTMYVLFTVIEVLFLARERQVRNGAKKNQKISF